MSDIFFPMDDTQYVGHAWKSFHEAVMVLGHQVVTIGLRVYDEIGLRSEGEVPDDLDACAFIAPHPDCPQLRRIVRAGVPSVLVGSKLPIAGTDCVDVDNRKVGQLAGDLFLKAGHERVAFVTTSPTQVSSMERHAGLQQAYRAAGKPASSVKYYSLNEPTTLEDTDALAEDLVEAYSQIESFGWHGNPGVMEAFLAQLKQDGVTALLSFNDQDARMIVDRLIRSGRGVPSEVSVVGVDNVGRFVLGNPRLSSIGQNVPQICRVAVRLLMARIEDPHAPSQVVLVQPSLHDRGSVVPPVRAAA